MMQQVASEGQRALRVFLSYTYRDLREHAAVVTEAVSRLGWVSVRMDEFGASDRPPFAVARDMIATCDALIVLVAFMYGYVPPVASEDGDSVHSWTFLEVLEAEKRGIPVLAFLMAEDTPVSPQLVDVANAELLLGFKAYLKRKRLVSSFTTASDLAAKVTQALTQLQPELLRRDRGSPEQQAGVDRPVDGPLPDVRVDLADDELLRLAWRLVVDFQAEPDMLLHLDATRWRAAITKLERELNAGQSRPWAERLAALRTHLEDKQPRLEPNVLWVAWMRTVHALKIETLRSLPATATAVPAASGHHPGPADGYGASPPGSPADPPSETARGPSIAPPPRDGGRVRGDVPKTNARPARPQGRVKRK